MNFKSLVLSFCAAATLGAAEYTFDTPDKWQQPKLLTTANNKLIVDGPKALIAKKLVKINPGDTIKIRGSYIAAANTPADVVYIGFKAYDKNRNELRHHHVIPYPGTDTTLAKAANVGDKVIYITNGEKWTAKSAMVVSNTAADLSDIPNFNTLSQAKKVEKENNLWKITLATPIKKAIAQGTNMRQHKISGHMYYVFGMTKPGFTDPRANMIKKMWPGVAYVRFLVYANWRQNKAAKLEMTTPGFEVVPAAAAK